MNSLRTALRLHEAIALSLDRDIQERHALKQIQFTVYRLSCQIPVIVFASFLHGDGTVLEIRRVF